MGQAPGEFPGRQKRQDACYYAAQSLAICLAQNTIFFTQGHSCRPDKPSTQMIRIQGQGAGARELEARGAGHCRETVPCQARPGCGVQRGISWDGKVTESFIY